MCIVNKVDEIKEVRELSPDVPTISAAAREFREEFREGVLQVLRPIVFSARRKTRKIAV